MIDETKLNDIGTPKKPRQALTFGLILFYILVAGAYLRFVGLDWDIDHISFPSPIFGRILNDGTFKIRNGK